MSLTTCYVNTNSNQKDMATKLDAAFPLACYQENMRLFSVPLHWHDEYEYIAAVKGIVTVYLNTRPVELKEGDSVFINSGCLHSVKSVTSGTSMLKSHVFSPRLVYGNTDSIFFQRLLPLSGRDALPYIPLCDGRDYQKEICENMLKAWEAAVGETEDYENEARYFITKAMYTLLNHLPEKNNLPQSNNQLLERVKISTEFIEAHYMEDIGNSDLTRLTGCSESGLLRCFKYAAGTSPMQYLQNFRLQKSAELLLTTRQKSGDIARACGFNDFSYFTKIFRRCFGETPLEYREKRLNDNF